MKIVKTLSAKFNAQAVCTIEVEDLEPGSYVLIGEIGGNLKKNYIIPN